jgi:hypothetical protein
MAESKKATTATSADPKDARIQQLEQENAALNERVQAFQVQAEERAASPVLDQGAKAALRQAVNDFREVEASPPGVDRPGMMGVAGKTLADRVEGVIG